MENESIRGDEGTLSIGKTVSASFQYVWRKRRELLLPLGILVLAQLVSRELLLWLIWRIRHAALCAYIPVWVAQVTFMVGLQRRLYLGQQGSGLRLFVLDRTWLRSMRALVEVMLGTAIVAIVLLVAGVVMVTLWHLDRPFVAMALAMLVGLIATVFLPMRLILAVPAAALGQRKYLSLSWHAMKGNSFKVFCAGILINVPFFIVGAPLAWEQLSGIAQLSKNTAFAVRPMAVMDWLLWLIGSALGNIGGMTTIVMLCIVYGSLVVRRGMAGEIIR